MRKTFLLLLLAIASFTLQAQAPSGYYNSANGKTGEELRAALHDIIKGHTTISYQQIWNAFWSTDNKGNNIVWDMYSDGATYTYSYQNGNDQCGSYDGEGDCYNREHSWPKSWFSGGEDGVPGRDLHHIFPTDGYVNAQRSNYPFGEVQSASWTSKNGSKLGSCKTSGYSGTVFEPIDEYKGDFARAYFYMSTRYYTEDSNWGSSGMTNKSDLEDWAVTMLLRWSDNDPVSQKEIDRNNAVYGIQGNRNPFIDHPEYAHIIWEEGWTGVTYNIACAQVNYGTITAPSSAVEGTLVTLTATPATGYMLGSWSVYKTGDTSTTVSVSDNGTFTMPAFNVTVSATFVQNNNYYTITKGTVSNGDFTVSATSARSGSTITLNASPATGYILYDWYVYKTDDINTHVAVSKSGNTGTFTMPAFNVTVQASFAQSSGGGDYEKVTSALTDWSGEYLIVYEDGNKAFNGGLSNLDATPNTIDVTINNDKTIESNSTTNAAKFTIASITGGYSIQAASGKYIGNNSNSNGLTSNDSPMTNAVSFNEDESSINIISSGGAYLRYNPSNGQEKFRYFKSATYSNQKAIQLYKKSNGSAATPTHTIQFNPNGAEGESYIQTVDEFESVALTQNTFIRQGYAFDSWNTKADGTGTTYFDGAMVSLLNDLTLYAQWVPVYSITVETPTGGSISASTTEAAEGAIIALTATPNNDYEFDAWMVSTDNDQPVTVEDNQFEMPASNVTVSATFVYVGQSYQQQYHLVTSTDQLVAGRTYLIVNTTAGKALGTTQNSNNRAAASVNISGNVINSIGTDVCELTLGGQNGAWTFYDTLKDGYLFAPGNGNYLRTENTLDDKGKWTISMTNDGIATIVSIGSEDKNHLRYNTSSAIFSCYSSSASTSQMPLVSLFIRSEEYDHTASETIANLFPFDKHTVRNGATLTVTGNATCNDPGNLIIEDGAQLIHHNTGVQATFKKSIEAYTETGGWYTIATPFISCDPAGTLATNDYDLYYYDEDGDSEGKEWINYKAGNYNLAAGQGYLYAHNPATTLRMTGTLNSGDYTMESIALGYANSESSLKGYNLLGNPTARDINFSKSDNVSDGYYYLDNSEAWVYEAGNTVPAGRGFLVKANGTGQTVTLNPTAKRGGKVETVCTPSLLCIDVDGEKAYLKLIDGVSMPLLGFRGKTQSVYLTRDHQPYVMLVRDGADAIDLNFKASKNGTCTLTVSAPLTSQLSPLNYLHLIDNLTGADIDLLETPSYTFDAKVTDYASRFKLVFGEKEDNDDNDDSFAYYNNGQLIVNGEGTLQVIDALGRRVLSQEINTPHSSLLTPHLIPGVYVLRLVTPEKVRIQKIGIQN